jgi:hypothetical protein
VEDGGDYGGLAGGDQDAQDQVAMGPGSTLSPGNSPPPRGSPALTRPQAIQRRLKQKLDAAAERQALQDQMAQVDRDARAQVNREREEAHQESQRREAQRERAQQKDESKRIKAREAEKKKKKKGGKGTSGWAPIPMRDDDGLIIYDQSGRPRYHPHNEPQDGPATKKKKPPPRRPTSPPPPTTPTSGRVQTPMRDERGLRLYDHSGHSRYLPQDESQDGPTTTPTATSTPATRRSTRTRSTPRRLQDYIVGEGLDSDSLGLNPIPDHDVSEPIPDYEQRGLTTRLDQSREFVEMRIQEQEEELRARNAQEQARIQKRLSKGPRNKSPRED